MIQEESLVRIQIIGFVESDQIAARNPVHKRGHRGREEPVVQPATEDRLYRRSGIAGFVLRPAGRKGVLGADQAEDSEG